MKTRKCPISNVLFDNERDREGEGAKSKEQGAKSKEQGAKSKEQGLSEVSSI